MYEHYFAAEGKWKNSKLHVQLQEKSTKKFLGLRKWYTWVQLVEKHGEDIAKSIVETKENDEKLRESEIRHGCEEKDGAAIFGAC